MTGIIGIGGGGGGGGGSGRAAYVKISECLGDNGETINGPWEYFAAGGGGGAGGAGGPSCRIIEGTNTAWFKSIYRCEIVDGTNPPDLHSGFSYMGHHWCLICGIGGRGGGANNMPSPGTEGAIGYCSYSCCVGGFGGDAGTGVSVCVNDGGQNPTYMVSWCTFDCVCIGGNTCVCNVICLPGANAAGEIGENVGGAGGMGGAGAPFCGDGAGGGACGDNGGDGGDGWVCIKF